jgi:predicted ATP-dependent Lon-type protease
LETLVCIVLAGRRQVGFGDYREVIMSVCTTASLATSRDVKAVRKTVSGLVKLTYPNTRMAIEGRAVGLFDNLAMLLRREGETLAELLTRLDLAIAKARTEDIFTNEINPPHS